MNEREKVKVHPLIKAVKRVGTQVLHNPFVQTSTMKKRTFLSSNPENIMTVSTGYWYKVEREINSLRVCILRRDRNVEEYGKIDFCRRAE